jgi:hypothetical protein
MTKVEFDLLLKQICLNSDGEDLHQLLTMMADEDLNQILFSNPHQYSSCEW